MPDPSFALIEPIPIADEYSCGLAHIEDLGDTARFVFYTDQVLYEDGNRPIRVVSRKIIVPLSAIRPGIDMALRYMARRTVRTASRKLLRLVVKD